MAISVYLSLFTVFVSLCIGAPVNKQAVVFYTDPYNHYLVMVDGSICYFWRTSGQDAETLKIQSGQVQLEERMIKAIESGTSSTPFTPDKESVSFVVVNRCRGGSSNLVGVPASG